MIIDHIKEVLCRLFCPGYLERMPKEDEPGQYVAEAFTTTIRGYGRVVYSERAEGLIAAYKLARWLGLKADWSISDCGGRRGIGYGVRKVME